LVDHYSNRIYRLALKMLGDSQDAEDVLQETFIKALRSIRDFEGRSNLSTWLFRIAVNESLMLIRRRHPEAVSIEDPGAIDAEGEESDDALPNRLGEYVRFDLSPVLEISFRNRDGHPRGNRRGAKGTLVLGRPQPRSRGR
jgi:RNA polymerase sigma factor (sigma-70 family)